LLVNTMCKDAQKLRQISKMGTVHVKLSL
jgi:hypothetical protein